MMAARDYVRLDLHGQDIKKLAAGKDAADKILQASSRGLASVPQKRRSAAMQQLLAGQVQDHLVPGPRGKQCGERCKCCSRQPTG